MSKTSSTQDFLFELGTEELPPKSLATLSEALLVRIKAGIDKAGLKYGLTEAFASPRRLAVLIRDLQLAQADQMVERKGPAVSAAFNADGSLTKAAEGFLRSCQTTLDQVTRLKTEKAEFLVFKQEVKGAKTAELLPAIIKQSLGELPIAKRMRWGAGTAEFVRPAQWVLLLLGSEVINTEILDLKSGRKTFGHRFHHPEAIEIKAPGDYREALLKTGKVIVSLDERKNNIKELAEATAKEVGGFAHIEPDLLDEVTALVEWPVPVLGGFEARFLALPPEVLITTMQENQKYFPLKDKDGKLMPYFITFSNVKSSRIETVREGNERVVRPRLSDAEFFWNQDRKNSLESLVPKLAEITFQNKLGSLLDKSKRVQKLAVSVADQLKKDSAMVG